ncbi:MAG TPA: hypothetical protein VK604_15560 [Bryobacteraceae bacterium]|nr:hypothetical protein [Bryobacteraceae bacterium]
MLRPIDRSGWLLCRRPPGFMWSTTFSPRFLGFETNGLAVAPGVGEFG